ncbi:hypothetical protein N0V90_006503 [Kalmusia sp. IMI 367209]|nr:hypothetical protein N0V90_006503 [Kalmusia sp. IMI 367209]
MALATLYAKVNPFKKNYLPKVHGFIIDHKARPESAKEARWVAQQLRSKFGIESTIVPVTWPEDFDLSNPKRFESEARKLRYQALGTACRDKGIKNLMVAHHADDQVETILMRLMNLRLRSGLRGMQRVEWIPECYGIHGVHHSSADTKSEVADRKSTGVDQARERQELSMPYPIEQGGIQILRPLLGFTKNRLIATCVEHNTQWVEDKTNQDATLTARNAIRHIFNNHQLPKALSRESLLALAEHTQSRVDKHKKKAEQLFSECPVKIDIQTGALVARFPPVDALFSSPTSHPSESDLAEARNTAYLFLYRLAELVSPSEKPKPARLANTVLSVWPTLACTTEPRSPNFSCFGLWWRKWDLPSPSTAHHPTPTPRMASLAPTLPLSDNLQHSIFFPPNEGRLSEWRFFDGRFWIRVRNLTDKNIVLRNLTDKELEELLRNKITVEASGYYHDRHQHLRAALAAIKPHSLRRHLPALFLAPDDPGAEQSVIALPTLNADLSVLGKKGPDCRWDVRYKKIDPGTRALEDIVLKPMQYGVAREESRRSMKATLGFKRLSLGTERAKEDVRRKKKKQHEEKRQMSEGLGSFMEAGEVETRRSYKLFDEPGPQAAEKKDARLGWSDFEERI